MKCSLCPAGPDAACRSGVFCEWAEGGDPVHVRHIRQVSALDAGRPILLIGPAVPCPGSEVTAPVTGVPLAGDLVEALARRVGADRAARWIAAKLGSDCGCAARRAMLNRIDAAARRFLGWPVEIASIHEKSH